MMTRTHQVDDNNNNDVPASSSKIFRKSMKVNSDLTEAQEKFIKARGRSLAADRTKRESTSSSNENASSKSVYQPKSKMKILKKRPRRSNLFIKKEAKDVPAITVCTSVLDNSTKSQTVKILANPLRLQSSSEDSSKQELERNSGITARIAKLNTQQEEPSHLIDAPNEVDESTTVQEIKCEFIPHPVSRGGDFLKMYVESYLLAKAEAAKLALPSGVIKTFYHNFKDPVPIGHQYVVLPESFYSSEHKKKKENQKPAETIEKIEVEELDDANKDLLLTLYFNNVCASFMLKEKCNAPCPKPHNLPLASEVEKALVKKPLEDAVNVHKLLQSFSSEIRIQYFPALANVFARKNSTDSLKTLINSVQAITPFSGFDFIITALIENGWNRCEALHFAINNHTESETARINLLGIVGTTGSDVVQFVDFLKKPEQ